MGRRGRDGPRTAHENYQGNDGPRGPSGRPAFSPGPPDMQNTPRGFPGRPFGQPPPRFMRPMGPRPILQMSGQQPGQSPSGLPPPIGATMPARPPLGGSSPFQPPASLSAFKDCFQAAFKSTKEERDQIRQKISLSRLKELYDAACATEAEDNIVEAFRTTVNLEIQTKQGGSNPQPIVDTLVLVNANLSKLNASFGALNDKVKEQADKDEKSQAELRQQISDSVLRQDQAASAHDREIEEQNKNARVALQATVQSQRIERQIYYEATTGTLANIHQKLKEPVPDHGWKYLQQGIRKRHPIRPLLEA